MSGKSCAFACLVASREWWHVIDVSTYSEGGGPGKRTSGVMSDRYIGEYFEEGKE